MKNSKILFFGMLAGLLFCPHSQAATSNVFGSIEPIIISISNADLTLVSFTVDPTTNTFVLINSGNLNFGTIDLTVNGIYENTPNNGGYGDAPHRAGSRYNDFRFYVGNNQDRYTVQTTFAGDILGLPYPTPTPSHPEGTSPIHLTTYRFTDSTTHGTLTNTPSNIRFEGVAKAVFSNIPMVLYDSGSSVLQDAFGVYVALDFLALTLPSGSYNGIVTWEVLPTP
jgi:hypothetical protein